MQRENKGNSCFQAKAPLLCPHPVSKEDALAIKITAENRFLQRLLDNCNAET
jgi:hypothetical protein